ncbi:MAG TPA: hypothetical protein VJ866_17570 [Pyrinomonadaceae bacterium]|nr:hypothetical protein [Pyrinomonadaceae bacterium]
MRGRLLRIALAGVAAVTVTAAALLLALLCSSARAASVVVNSPTVQENGKSQLIVPLQSGAFVRIRTEADAQWAGDATSNLIEAEDKPNLLHRVFVDSKNGLFFGYELVVERAAEARYFWVTVRALSDEYLRELAARPAFRGRRLHPSYNATAFPAGPQFVRDGDTFALDVLRNPRTGAKIVDVVQVTLSDPGLRTAAADQPRDFSPEDVQLKVSNYSLRVNGETVYRSTGGAAGALVWFSLGDRGRFVFSLVPRPGYNFEKVGTVRQNVIRFESGGDTYEWESALPVVNAGGNWNIWVLHDPDYSVDLFGPAPAPPSSESNKTMVEKADEAARQMRRRASSAQAGYGAQADAQEPGTQEPARARRVRVVIGSADDLEQLFPRQQR